MMSQQVIDRLECEVKEARFELEGAKDTIEH